MKAAGSNRAQILAEADTLADKAFLKIPVVPFTTLIYSSDGVLLFLYVGLRPRQKQSFTLDEFQKCRQITAKYVASSGKDFDSDRLSVSTVFFHSTSHH